VRLVIPTFAARNLHQDSGIAAGSRASLMWGDFVDDFRRSPIPKAWRGTDLEQIYYGGVDGFSRSCEVWLAKNYKAEYHVVDELRGAPTMPNSGLDEKAPPVLVGGGFWHPVPAGPLKTSTNPPPAPAKPRQKT